MKFRSVGLLFAAALVVCLAGCGDGKPHVTAARTSQTSQAPSTSPAPSTTPSDMDLLANLVADGLIFNGGLSTFGFVNVVPSSSPLELFFNVSPLNTESCPVSGTYSVTGSDNELTNVEFPNVTFTLTNCRWQGAIYGTSDLTVASGSVLMTGTSDHNVDTLDAQFTSSDLTFSGVVDGVPKSGTNCSINIAYHFTGPSTVHFSGSVCGLAIAGQ